MRRIAFRPAEIKELGFALRRMASALRYQVDHLQTALHGLDWETTQQAHLEEQVAAAVREGRGLAGQAEAMGSDLVFTADEFLRVDRQGVLAVAAANDTARELRLALEESGALLGAGVREAEQALRLNMGAGAAIAGTLAVTGGLGWSRKQFGHLFGQAPGLAGSSPGNRAGLTSGDRAGLTSGAIGDPYWQSVGAPPVADGRFTADFGGWAARFNDRVGRHWDGQTGPDGQALADVYRLTPAKVTQLWTETTVRRVDPRLLLAILAHEGTGSFNTNGAGAGAYGGHGPQPDFAADLQAALEGPILGKLRLYSGAVAAGFTGTWLEWINWYTPMDTEWANGDAGVYAQDIGWAAGVERHYRDLSAATGTSGQDPVAAYGNWISQHPEEFRPRHIAGEFELRQGLPPGAARPWLALWHEAPKPDPAARLEGAFWWFEAPDRFCWYLERR